jgi:predicted dehydrogenase
MRELIGNGWLGKLHAVTVRGITPEHADRDARLHWRRQRKFSGVNMLTMGIWYEDALRWAGPASRVYAQARICAPRRRYGEGDAVVEVDIPDHVDILAELECGAQATFQFSAVYGPGVGSEVWLFGSEGTLHYDFNADKLLGVRRGEGGYREIEIAPQKAGRWRVAEEFVGAIRGEEEVAFTTFADGVTYMEFSEAVNRSAESGQPVSLPLPA